MKVYLYSAALRARYKAAKADAVEVEDDKAAHYLNVGVAGPVRGRVERAVREPQDNAALDLEALSKQELVELAVERGVDVERADGEDGVPLKADYIRALSGEA